MSHVQYLRQCYGSTATAAPALSARETVQSWRRRRHLRKVPRKYCKYHTVLAAPGLPLPLSPLPSLFELPSLALPSRPSRSLSLLLTLPALRHRFLPLLTCKVGLGRGWCWYLPTGRAWTSQNPPASPLHFFFLSHDDALPPPVALCVLVGCRHCCHLVPSIATRYSRSHGPNGRLERQASSS